MADWVLDAGMLCTPELHWGMPQARLIALIMTSRLLRYFLPATTNGSVSKQREA